MSFNSICKLVLSISIFSYGHAILASDGGIKRPLEDAELPSAQRPKLSDEENVLIGFNVVSFCHTDDRRENEKKNEWLKISFSTDLKDVNKNRIHKFISVGTLYNHLIYSHPEIRDPLDRLLKKIIIDIYFAISNMRVLLTDEHIKYIQSHIYSLLINPIWPPLKWDDTHTWSINSCHHKDSIDSFYQSVINFLKNLYDVNFENVLAKGCLQDVNFKLTDLSWEHLQNATERGKFLDSQNDLQRRRNETNGGGQLLPQ